jgi:aspartate carbamoyltransferase catalytic subunit
MLISIQLELLDAPRANWNPKAQPSSDHRPLTTDDGQLTINVQFNRKHLLGIRELEAGEITHLLDTAETFRDISKREIKKVPALRGRTVINLFFESSTRTRTSFEIAAKRLSADAINISVSTSSVSKGETLLDTARNLEAMSPDCIVVRHSMAGAPHHLARMGNAPIVNAGDGSHEHPTQALLDALTIREYKGRIEGLRVAILGDVLHSRVARSNIHLLTKLGATVSIAGPGTLVPEEFGELVEQGLRVEKRIEDAIEGADVVMILRSFPRCASMPSTSVLSQNIWSAPRPTRS